MWAGNLQCYFPLSYLVNAKIYKVACSRHVSMSKAVFGVKYMGIVWGGVQSVSLRAQPLLSVTSLLLKSQYFLTLLACAMIKQESVCWWISTVVKQSRTHLQRSVQHVINEEQFIHNLSSSWWTCQAQEGFQNRKLLWRTEASLGSVIYHCMLCKNSSMLTHLQSPIYKAVEQFFPENLRIRKYWSVVEFCLPLTHI